MDKVDALVRKDWCATLRMLAVKVDVNVGTIVHDRYFIGDIKRYQHAAGFCLYRTHRKEQLDQSSKRFMLLRITPSQALRRNRHRFSRCAVLLCSRA
ncbi:hypothetical protein TNIN_289271 [Trichonephila inaurata madagascariensis]|uniref:Uncharacterized protein n=1 Tax=Trichonephila inaurata madagascariensis TaxID=2747483 RepID=A0A8X6XX10_9ARAC|nr:hypothetical protein TNIN_289271 [Trichonephila inaurata madagascariensis]